MNGGGLTGDSGCLLSSFHPPLLNHLFFQYSLLKLFFFFGLELGCNVLALSLSPLPHPRSSVTNGSMRTPLGLWVYTTSGGDEARGSPKWFCPFLCLPAL